KSGWEIECKATMEKIVWEQEPVLEWGPVTLNLTRSVEAKLQDTQKKIEEVVEQQVNKVLHIRDAIKKIWNDLQKPIIVNKKGMPLWLKMTGHDLQACWLTKHTANPTILISVQGYYELTAGDTSEMEN